MPQTPVGADLLKAFHVLGALPAQIALDLAALDRLWDNAKRILRAEGGTQVP